MPLAASAAECDSLKGELVLTSVTTEAWIFFGPRPRLRHTLFKVNGKRCVFSAQLDLVSTQHELQLSKQTVSPMLRVSDVCVRLFCIGWWLSVPRLRHPTM